MNNQINNMETLWDDITNYRYWKDNTSASLQNSNLVDFTNELKKY